MLTAHTIKILQSLDKKKFRQKHQLVVVEGNKIIRELPNSGYKINEIFSINPIDSNLPHIPITTITERDLNKISFLQHPRDSVALCVLPVSEMKPEPPVQLVLD